MKLYTCNKMFRVIVFIIFIYYYSVGGMEQQNYKIDITQKGYAQFIEYDVDIPLREFTFCIWIRVFNYDSDQIIFSYIAKGSLRVASLWLDEGGKNLVVSFNGIIFPGIPIDWNTEVWKNICLSYQSDYGAWALYIDGRLTSCETSQMLTDYELPGGGNIVIGYDRKEYNYLSGLEGEIFGFYLILKSTIERNATSHIDFRNIQPLSIDRKRKNTLSVNNVRLSDLDTPKTNDMFEESEQRSITSTTPHNVINFSKQFTPINHSLNHNLPVLSYPKRFNNNDKRKILNLSEPNLISNPKNKDNINTWNFVNRAGNQGMLKKQSLNFFEQINPAPKNLPNIPLYKTPPPKRGPLKHIEKHENKIYSKGKPKDYISKISEIETPPPIQKKGVVYGQWLSSNFSNNVLNYLKSRNIYKKDTNKTPKTIPLTKVSDSFPYSSEFKGVEIKPQRQKEISVYRNFRLKRNANTMPVINVEIENEDIRQDILNLHAQTHPKNVIVTNRGESKTTKGYDYLYKKNKELFDYTNQGDNKSRPFRSKKSRYRNHRNQSYHIDLRKTNNVFSNLPFIKFDDNYTQVSVNSKSKEVNSAENNTDDMYSQSLSKHNKWHNIKSYNDHNYSPGQIIPIFQNLKKTDAERNDLLPFLRDDFRQDHNNNIQNKDIIGYNVKYVNQNSENTKKSGQYGIEVEKQKLKQGINISRKVRLRDHQNDNFNKHVKIGNALDEHEIIGLNEDKKQLSFLGGDDRVPDINHYRSDIDENYDNNVPPSLEPEVCRNVNINTRILYIQSDGSIKGDKIHPPIKSTNVAIKFILEIYKKCSLRRLMLPNNPLLLINWNKTPIKLFGGVYPSKTKDLCEFRSIDDVSFE